MLHDISFRTFLLRMKLESSRYLASLNLAKKSTYYIRYSPCNVFTMVYIVYVSLHNIHFALIFITLDSGSGRLASFPKERRDAAANLLRESPKGSHRHGCDCTGKEHGVAPITPICTEYRSINRRRWDQVPVPERQCYWRGWGWGLFDFSIKDDQRLKMT
jgi:hypothetical protein